MPRARTAGARQRRLTALNRDAMRPPSFFEDVLHIAMARSGSQHPSTCGQAQPSRITELVFAFGERVAASPRLC